jgi:aryl-alcohol dehydrogenase-like predicted oxidoreductase
VVATKGGMNRSGDDSKSWRMPRLSADEMERRIHASRTALGLDGLDVKNPTPITLYQLHHPEAIGTPSTDPESNFGVVLTRIQELKQRGVIRYFGLCNARLY